MSKSDKDHSRFLSLVLRHKPEEIGLTLDPQGWVAVEDLLTRLPFALTRDDLNRLVAGSDKQRFALSEDGQRIRANQGHSVTVELGLPATKPPAVLYHGTAAANQTSILSTGIDRRTRHHVHLSPTVETALRVGARHGTPIVLQVDAEAMAGAGHSFFLSENGVWLVDGVPPEFLRVITP
ncbi:RNA 2'-phosphotransferase [Paracoccaceae bacterium]